LRPAPETNEYELRGAGRFEASRHTKVWARNDLGLQSMLLQADGPQKRRHAAALQGALRALILSGWSKNYAALGETPALLKPAVPPSE